MQRWLIGALLLGALMGMAGGTWDAAWHVSQARETFWSPPHLLLYAGTTVSLLVAAAALGSAWWWGWSALGETVRVPGIGRRFPLGFTLVGLGACIVIGAAPLDEFWHRTFGRDVDVWSFPHLVALAGGCVINFGALAAVAADARRGGGWTLSHRIVTALFLAVLVWVTMFSLNWYTLVLAVFRDSVQYPLLATLVATPALVLAAMALGRGGATLASLLYMAYAAGAHGFLASQGYALLPFPPMLLGPALVIDAVLWGRQRASWRRALWAGLLFAPAFYLAEAASLAWYPHPQLEGLPRGIGAGYHQAVLQRPWDVAHIAVALPFGIAIGGLTALFGWLVGRRLGVRNSRRAPRATPNP